MKLQFSFIIPVYNRPNEIYELLQSFIELDTSSNYEIVIIEDGSDIDSKTIIKNFEKQLNISYYAKENSGPGDSRNYGMRKAKGNYFIILDSDCILPKQYLKEVEIALKEHYVDYFGGPDTAHASFSNLQKAINFSMTSFITTGGIRGSKHINGSYQPRSFNMGISKKAFKASNGFGNIHPGEDPNLSIRLKNLGFTSVFIPKAFVYHKRRISLTKFYEQVFKFGIARAILNTWHPKTRKVTYWLPFLFSIGFLFAIILSCFGHYIPIFVYFLYFISCFLFSFITYVNFSVAFLSIFAVSIQFFGYGYGFLKANIKIWLSKKRVEVLFPKMFFKPL